MCWKQKFWAKVNKTDKCWIWQAARSSRPDDQYGKIKIDSKVYRSHRVAYAISNNLELTFKGHVLHSCDNPLCCNPEHLSLGTHRQNMEQMKLRGRAGKTNQKGAKNHNSKLTDLDVIKIREFIDKKLSNKKIATIFGVTHHTISCIKRGITW